MVFIILTMYYGLTYINVWVFNIENMVETYSLVIHSMHSKNFLYNLHRKHLCGREKKIYTTH